MPQYPKTVFLVGFMGSGKTTLGKKLAAKMKYECIDLDAAIEKAEGLYIRDIIKEKGEGYFREVESYTLKHLDTSGKVIATGGGTACFHENMQWMRSHGTVVFIEMDEGVLFNRLKSTEIDNRPLLKDIDDAGLRDFIRAKLSERLPYYKQADISHNPVKLPLESLLNALDRTHIKAK